MAESSATYLFKGLFPNISRYLTGKSRHVTKQVAGPTSVAVLTKTLNEAVTDIGSIDDQGSLIEGITEVIVEKDPPAEQLVAPRFICPRPSVTFAEVPAICGVQSDSVVTKSVFNPRRPLFLRETTSPSSKPLNIEVETMPTEGSSVTPVKATPTSQQSPIVEAETRAQTLRPAFFASFKSESRKSLNHRNVPTSSIDRSRNVLTSSNETLVWGSNGSSSESSPVASHSGRKLQHAAEKTIIQKQADKIHAQEEVCEELRIELADRTRQSEELKADLKLCQRDRERNLNWALGLYRNTGNLALLERQTLVNKIHLLKSDVQNRESEIWSRDQLIEALRFDVDTYANQEQWNRMRRSFHALQQQYGQMPQTLRTLQRNYENLEDQHLDLSNRFKKLEGDHTELKAQCDQIRYEKDQLEDVAQGSKPSSSEAEARYWALEVERDHILEEKARSEKEATTKEQFLASLATRMFKRIIYMAGAHHNIDVDPKDEERTALCQLACKHLGFDPTEVADRFEKVRPSGSKQVEEDSNESGTPGKHASDDSPRISTAEPSKRQPIDGIAGANDISMIAAAKGKMPESPNTFDVKGRRGVAAAGEATPGMLGLEDGTTQVKSKQTPDGPTSSKKSIFKSLFPTSTDTPSKPWDAVPKEAFKTPQTQDFKFGESSGPVPFLGSGNCDPPRFGQDLNFGGSNAGVPFTASQKEASSLQAPAAENPSTTASSAPDSSTAASHPPTVPQGREKAPEEAVSTEDAIEQESTETAASPPNTPTNNNKKSKAKAKQPKTQAQKNPAPVFDGPNRKQRRAADRERKAADKKAQQAAAEKARKGRAGAKKGTQGGRNVLGRAVVREGSMIMGDK